MTNLEELYLNYRNMTMHLGDERMSFEEYKKSRTFVLGMMAETDAERILEAEAKRIEEDELA
jgi:hypothetical protein